MTIFSGLAVGGTFMKYPIIFMSILLLYTWQKIAVAKHYRRGRHYNPKRENVLMTEIIFFMIQLLLINHTRLISERIDQFRKMKKVVEWIWILNNFANPIIILVTLLLFVSKTIYKKFGAYLSTSSYRKLLRIKRKMPIFSILDRNDAQWLLQEETFMRMNLQGQMLSDYSVQMLKNRVGNKSDCTQKMIGTPFYNILANPHY